MGIISSLGSLVGILVNRGMARNLPKRHRAISIGLPRGLIDPVVPQMVEIGSNFVSSPGSIVLAHDESPYMHCGMYTVRKTTIGDNVFLGPGAIILPGATVGDGAIITAGSVVAGNVPPYSVVTGNPARVVCTVSEYVRDCRDSGCLCEVPEAFRRVFWGERLSDEDLKAFQKMVLERHAKDSPA